MGEAIRVAKFFAWRSVRSGSSSREPQSIDLLEISPLSISELNKFSKSNFSVDAILAQAERLRYVSATKRLFSHWFENPPAGLVKLVASEVHNGRITSQMRENISKIVVTAFREIVRDQLQTRLSTALEDPMGIEADLDAPIANREIETTDEEREGFLLIKALLRGDVSADRVAIRDAKSYCAILLDDNNRKPLARLHFNGKNKSISLFDGLKEDRFQISSLDEIISLRGRLIATAQKYDN